MGAVKLVTKAATGFVFKDPARSILLSAVDASGVTHTTARLTIVVDTAAVHQREDCSVAVFAFARVKIHVEVPHVAAVSGV